MPASTLRERLSKLGVLGLAEANPHRLAMLSDRPLLPRHPVSRHWLRLLSGARTLGVVR